MEGIVELARATLVLCASGAVSLDIVVIGRPDGVLADAAGTEGGQDGGRSIVGGSSTVIDDAGREAGSMGVGGGGPNGAMSNR